MARVLQHPDPRLRTVCKPVEAVTAEVRKLVQDLTRTMRELRAVGLAAPQLGNFLRVFVVQTRNGVVTFINPEILGSDDWVTTDEGCCSIPNRKVMIRRARKVTVRALDIDLKPFVLTPDDELVCQAIQHESDHLDGVLMLDHVDDDSDSTSSTILTRRG